MYGIIEFPEDENEPVNLLFFTKMEDAEKYKKLYAEKFPNEKMKYKIVKIQKHMCFDSGAENIDDCFYKFDPELKELEEDPILDQNDF